MSTRSFICKKTKSGWKCIYSHWDGYPDGVGKTLKKHYTNPTKVDRLIKLGSISVLGEDIGTKHSFEDRTNEKVTTAYGRDRGEKGQGSTNYITKQDAKSGAKSSWAEYIYFFENGKWEHEEV